MFNHLNQNNLLSSSQYGFRAGHSCEHALIDLQEDLLDNISNNRHRWYTLRKKGSLAVPQVEPLKVLKMVLNESLEQFLEPF